MSASDYIFTPKDIFRALHVRHLLGLGMGIAIIASLAILLKTGLDVALFAGLITTLLVWRLDARIPFAIAIICFVLIMIASIVAPSENGTQGTISETIAVVAFYCLVAGLALLIQEHARTTPHKDASQNKDNQPATITPLAHPNPPKAHIPSIAPHIASPKPVQAPMQPIRAFTSLASPTPPLQRQTSEVQQTLQPQLPKPKLPQPNPMFRPSHIQASVDLSSQTSARRPMPDKNGLINGRKIQL